MQLRPSGLILVKMDTGSIFHCLRDKEIRGSNGLESLSPKNYSNQCSARSVKASDSFCSLLYGTVHYRSLQCRVGALHFYLVNNSVTDILYTHIIQFVDSDNQLCYTKRPDKQGVFPGLTTSFKTRFKFTST